MVGESADISIRPISKQEASSVTSAGGVTVWIIDIVWTVWSIDIDNTTPSPPSSPASPSPSSFPLHSPPFSPRSPRSLARVISISHLQSLWLRIVGSVV